MSNLPLEKQVSSLEPSRRLKELGVKQKSLYYWVKGDKQRGVCPDCRKAGGLVPECAYCGGTGKDIENQNYYLYGRLEVWQEDRVKDYSAFTVAELGEMLPHRVKSFPFEKWHNDALLHELLSFRGVKYGYKMYYESDTGEEFPKPKDAIWADTEADARALMLIYLIENNLIKVEDINH